MTGSWENTSSTPLEDIRRAREALEKEAQAQPAGDDWLPVFPGQQELLGLPANAIQIRRYEFIRRTLARLSP